jgi:hypothetical protein
MGAGNGGQEIGRECRDSALPWQVVTDKGNFSNFGRFFHEEF